MGYIARAPLSSHPNFKAPAPNGGVGIEDIVRFTLEYVAVLISPPMEQDEDEERECVEIASEIRGSVAKVLSALKGKG